MDHFRCQGTLTTSGSSYTGEGQFTFLPELALSRAFDEGAVAGLKFAANVQYRLRPEARTLLNTDFGSEIVVRGAQVMSGYWNRPEETAAVLTADGFAAALPACSVAAFTVTPQ